MKIIEADIALASLNAAKIVPVNTCLLGKRLLAQVSLASNLTEVGRERLARWIGSVCLHAKEVAARPL